MSCLVEHSLIAVWVKFRNNSPPFPALMLLPSYNYAGWYRGISNEVSPLVNGDNYVGHDFDVVKSLAMGLQQGDRHALSRAITYFESTRLEHKFIAAALLRELESGSKLADKQQKSFKIGVSGPPGAGKSSLIEALGSYIVNTTTDKVAVLAIDPSSKRSGGAILGDKTRMPVLSASENAFVRPTPARGTLGGVGRSTSDAIIACSAGGYNRVLVETVGVGQSETAVEDLVDCFMLVVPPVGGDELQVIKRGITELADIVVVNKADGELKTAAARAAQSFRGTMHFHRTRRRNWTPVVLTCSALTGFGVDTLHQQLEECHKALWSSGELFEVGHAVASLTWHVGL